MIPRAVILAAGVGSRLRPLTDEIPKCLAEVGGKPMLGWMLESLAECGFEEAAVVTGHLADKVERFVADAPVRCRCVYNPRYASDNNYYSLLVARPFLEGRDFVKLDGDVIIESEVVKRVVAGDGKARVSVDRREDLGDEEMKVLTDPDGRITRISKALDPKAAEGESMGVEWISAESTFPLFEELQRMDTEGIHDEYYEFAYDRLMQRGHDFRLADVSGLRIIEIDDLADLEQAQTLF